MLDGNVSSISRQALKRLPYYLNYLKRKQEAGASNISAPIIAADLGLNEVQVRKDLAAVSSVAGRPKIGYETERLIRDVEDFLGYNCMNQAALVGVGHLGRALLNYKGFLDNGMEIVAAFDNDPNVIGEKVAGHQIVSVSKLEDLCKRMRIHIGIIAVDGGHAQEICDRLVSCGVDAIWNFAPVHLIFPSSIIMQQENMASSLAILSRKLQEKQDRIGVFK